MILQKSGKKFAFPAKKTKRTESTVLFSGPSGLHLHHAEFFAAKIRLSEVTPGHIGGGEGLGKRDIVQKNPRVEEIAAVALPLDPDDVMHRLTLPFLHFVRRAGVSV